MTKRKKVFLAAVVFVLLAAAGFGAALVSGAFESEPNVDMPQGELAYIGEHIGVSAEELRTSTQCLTGLCPNRTTYYNDSLKSISVREALSYRAREVGLEITDEEAQSAANARREEMQSQLNYEAMVLAYAEPLGLTEEEYWAYLPDDRAFRQELLVEKFTAKLRKEHSDLDDAEWDAWLSEYKTTAVAEENLVPAQSVK